MFNNLNPRKVSLIVLTSIALLALPILLQATGSNSYTRIVDMALLYVLLALGLNIVVGYAGLLDLGYIAFFAVGGYLYALLASPHLAEAFPAIQAMYPNGLHINIWLVMLLAAAVAGVVGMILGAPTLKLRGDYLAIITLGFGEIIRIFLLNLDRPVNITNGPKGISQIDPLTVFGIDLGQRQTLTLGDWSYTFQPVTMYYYLFLFFVVFSIVLSYRLQDSRIGRAWMAIREDETAAKAMGLNTRNLKLLAFGMGATFGGMSGVLFASFQRFVSPESFSLMESVMVVAMVVVGGIGHIPGVVLGALLLAGLPEVLRHVSGPLTDLIQSLPAPEFLREFLANMSRPEILRQLLIALAMVVVMLLRPNGLWPAPEHGKSLAK